MNNKEDVIERLCLLASKVGKDEFKHEISHDCFCGVNKYDVSTFRFEDEVIQFIENAVNKELSKRHRDEQ